MYASQLDANNREQVKASGHVELFRVDQHLATELIFYDPENREITMPVAVSYKDQQVWVRGEKAHYSFENESGRFSTIDYGLTGSSIRPAPSPPLGAERSGVRWGKAE